MQQSVTVEIECGKTTCASEPGKFCHLLTPSLTSDAGYCQIFGTVQAVDGWIQRDAECMRLAKSNEATATPSASR